MTNAIVYCCPYCDKIYDNDPKLSSHIAQSHKNEMMNEKVRIPIHDSPYKVELNISKSQLNNLRLNHSNKCDICGKIETANTRPKEKSTPNKLCIDHSHNSNKFRGFLCVQCNRNMGWYDKYKEKIKYHELFGNSGL